MEFNDALEYFHSLNRFGVQPGLERIKALCSELGNPQNDFKCIHVAGTNGKGSTCTVISSVLRKAGYKVGLYTSPYVIEFRERIKLNGEFIGKDELCLVTDEVKKAMQRLGEVGIYPTEFEAVTAAAFLFYSKQKCDVVVLETGLGGRFDATNIIKEPLVSVITSISLDHTAILGDTIERISWEKAGIIKKNRPVVTSCTQPDDALRVIRDNADELNSEVYLTDYKSSFRVFKEGICYTDFEYNGSMLHLPFGGVHQLENVSLCLKTFELLNENGYDISEKAVIEGIASSFIPARTEIICPKPTVILDGCHNDSSTAALGALLREFYSEKPIVAVMGMMADKDCRTALFNLLPCFSEVIAVTPSNPRAMKASDFARLVDSFGVPCTVRDKPTAGIDTAFDKAAKESCTVVVCGSLYLAGDVRDYMISEVNNRFGFALNRND